MITFGPDPPPKSNHQFCVIFPFKKPKIKKKLSLQYVTSTTSHILLATQHIMSATKCTYTYCGGQIILVNSSDILDIKYTYFSQMCCGNPEYRNMKYSSYFPLIIGVTIIRFFLPRLLKQLNPN